LIEIAATVTVRGKYDALAVGRENWVEIVRWIECQPCRCATDQIEKPDVSRPGSGVSLDSQGVAVRRERRIAVVGGRTEIAKVDTLTVEPSLLV